MASWPDPQTQSRKQQICAFQHTDKNMSKSIMRQWMESFLLISSLIVCVYVCLCFQEAGVKVYVLLYKEVPFTVSTDSKYSKRTLMDLHNNIKVWTLHKTHYTILRLFYELILLVRLFVCSDGNLWLFILLLPRLCVIPTMWRPESSCGPTMKSWWLSINRRPSWAGWTLLSADGTTVITG